jgi:hypothetical protein
MEWKQHLWVGLIVVALTLSNCTAALIGAGAGSGIGTYSYLNGELTVDYPYSYDDTWQASLTAFERLRIELISQARDSLSGRITGKRGDGKTVVVKIKDKGLGVTTVGVRVGTFGNRDVSRRIQETILKALRS